MAFIYQKPQVVTVDMHEAAGGGNFRASGTETETGSADGVNNGTTKGEARQPGDGAGRAPTALQDGFLDMWQRFTEGWWYKRSDIDTRTLVVSTSMAVLIDMVFAVIVSMVLNYQVTGDVSGYAKSSNRNRFSRENLDTTGDINYFTTVCQSAAIAAAMTIIAVMVRNFTHARVRDIVYPVIFRSVSRFLLFAPAR